jgi:hypothetical protein
MMMINNNNNNNNNNNSLINPQLDFSYERNKETATEIDNLVILLSININRTTA